MRELCCGQKERDIKFSRTIGKYIRVVWGMEDVRMSEYFGGSLFVWDLSWVSRDSK